MGSGARLTVCAWVKPDSNDPNWPQNFAAKTGAGGGTYEYCLRYDGRVDRFTFVATSNGYGSTLGQVDGMTERVVSVWKLVSIGNN